MGSFFSSLFDQLSGRLEARILMLGLDGAGKTTILFKLKLGEVVHTIPTIGFNVESIQYRNVKLQVWDVGGQDKIRRLWKFYYQNTQALIFVVDSNDTERISLAEEQLHAILDDEEMRNIVLLVLANKQDVPHALSTSELTDRLGLHRLRNNKWFIQGACATTADGIYEGLEWLTRNIK